MNGEIKIIYQRDFFNLYTVSNFFVVNNKCYYEYIIIHAYLKVLIIGFNV